MASEDTVALLVNMLQKLSSQVTVLQKDNASLRTTLAGVVDDIQTLKAQTNLVLHQTNPNRRFFTKLSDLPFEVFAKIFAYVPPTTVFKLRRLSKAINSCLVSAYFAALSLPIHVATKKQRLFINSKPDSFDTIWFFWPPNYQAAYAALKLSHFHAIQWTSIDWSKYKKKTLSTREMRDAPFSQLIQMGLALRDNGRMGRKRTPPLLIQIPSAIGYLNQLKTLQLASCEELVGEIPKEIGSLTSLEILNLSKNGLEGEIPVEFRELQSLQELNLFGNQLTGGIDVLCSITSLKQLNLHKNKFSGHLPSALGQLKEIVGLFLSDNEFTGPIPSVIQQLENLAILNLFENSLTGTIPLMPPRLEHLNLFSNELEGTIPSQLGELRFITHLNCSKNNLSGSIPHELCSGLTPLQMLKLSDNKLTGEIPSTIHLLPLHTLILKNNSISGHIPGLPETLTALDLSGNQLSGSFPTNIGDLRNLTILNVSENGLNGAIPNSLCLLMNLQELGLANNNFVGRVPERFGALILEKLELSGNEEMDKELPQSVLGNTKLLEMLVQEGFKKGE
ncbi:RNI-like protein [Rhizoclosmatium globosum]|uniref:RNI-like protein n=1 Tax=Rhizoclosmatium globosum TaxID=329046 RepID=A0A1Y2CG13_9FUNG|nr:RNI-like protein [Rhizoclosmatium globosum]|eukprot:ORY46003.1 RNI-like protein [Rhizoclosmatium globosum]